MGDASNYVVFRPDTLATGSGWGNDWGGITITWYGSGSVLEYADVGYAPVPIFLDWPDSLTTVRRSVIHDFRDIGIWAYNPLWYAGGAVIESTTVARGFGQHPETGDIGILIDSGGPMVVRDNTVDLTGVDNDGGGAGIAFITGKFHCTTAGAPVTDVEILKNTVLGPGAASQTTFDLWSGIQLDWACGNRELVDVESNTVREWNQYGLEITQSSDVDVSCNTIRKSDRALEFSRDSQATGPKVRFFNNTLDSSATVAIRTDHGGKLAVSSNNALRTNSLSIQLVENDDATRPLDASTNAWFVGGVLSVNADTLNAVTIGWVDTSGAVSQYIAADCDAPAAWMGWGEGLLASGRAEDSGSGAIVEASLPAVTRLVGGYPSPFRGSVRLQFDVATADEGLARITIYDVRGRRVRTLWDGPIVGGRHPLYWNGRDEAGRAVTAGVYFVRMEVGVVVQVRKVVRLH